MGGGGSKAKRHAQDLQFKRDQMAAAQVNAQRQRDADQANAQAQLAATERVNKRDHDLKLKALENENADRMAQRENAREQLRLARLEAEKPKPHKIWTGNRERIQAALNEYTECAANQGNYLKKATEDKANSTAIIAESKIKLNAIQKLLFEFNKDEKLRGIKTEVRGFCQAFEDNDQEVRAVINKTCVHREHIADFLQLTANIIPTVMQGVQQSNNLGACFETFHALISRECRDDLTIDNYFAQKGMERFVEVLTMKKLFNLEDLECDDEDEFKDDILGMLQSAIDTAKEQKEEDGKDNDLAVDLNRAEKKKLKKICLKPETWQDFQRQKSALNKRILLQCGPPLMEFFKRTHFAMSEVGKLLEIGYEYNAEQQLALQGGQSSSDVQMVPALMPPPQQPIVSCPGEESSNNGINQEELKENETLDFEEDQDQEIVAETAIVPLKNAQLAKVSNDNMVIGKIAVSCVNVVASMKEDFEVSTKAQTFAYNIEDTCEKIVRAQCNLRRNVALAMEIAKLKPGHLTAEAEKMWASVDQGCVQIYKTTIDMIAVSAQYFGFFLRFRDSFSRYMEAMAMDENCSFVVSLEYLQKDLRAFLDFKNNYSKGLAVMNDTAMKCIADCVSNAIGGQNFESAQKDWKRSQEEYLDALKRLQVAGMAVDEEYLRLKNQESIVVAEIEKHEFLVETATDIIESIQGKTTNWDAKIAGLQQELANAKDYITEWKP